MQNFKDFLIAEKLATDTALAKFFKEYYVKQDRHADYRLMTNTVENLFLRGGKRARPLLARMAYRLAGGKKSEEMLKASLFLELIHSFLLVHDDIADQDLKRYGGPTLEVVFGEEFKKRTGKTNGHVGKTLALIAGDHLRTLADKALDAADFSDKVKNECKECMSFVLEDTFEGWLIQYWLNFSGINEAKEADFMRGLELVTARYTFEGPLTIGLILAGKRKRFEGVLRRYAKHAGVAYQIQDDILGVFGESEQTGKPVGNDIREGKKTLLILRAYKQASKREKAVLDKLVGTDLSLAELEKVRQIIVDTGSLEYSKNLAEEHVEQAKEEVEGIDSDDKETLDKLKSLADFVVGRKY